MRRIFGGLFFIILSFPLTLGRFTLDLLPDFAGYLLIFSGLGALADRAAAFAKLRFFTLILAVCTGAVWLTDLAGIGLNAEHVVLLREMFELTAMAVVIRVLIAGILQWQIAEGRRLAADALRSGWYALIVGKLASAVLIRTEVLAVAGYLVAAVMVILFLTLFANTVRLTVRQAPPLPFGFLPGSSDPAAFPQGMADRPFSQGAANSSLPQGEEESPDAAGGRPDIPGSPQDMAGGQPGSGTEAGRPADRPFSQSAANSSLPQGEEERPDAAGGRPDRGKGEPPVWEAPAGEDSGPEKS